MPEVFKPVAVKDFSSRYSVSNRGQVRRESRADFVNGGHRSVDAMPLKTWLNRRGYVAVRLSSVLRARQNFTVHQLVARTFLQRIAGCAEVNHIDGDKQNNTLENLEWSNPSDNQLHAVACGLRPIGEQMSQAKLTAAEVGEIRRLFKTGEFTKRDLSRRFGTTETNIGYVISRRTWRHLEAA